MGFVVAAIGIPFDEEFNRYDERIRRPTPLIVLTSELKSYEAREVERAVRAEESSALRALAQDDLAVAPWR